MTPSSLEITLSAMHRTGPYPIHRAQHDPTVEESGFSELSLHVHRLERRYAGLLALSDNGGFVDVLQLQMLLGEPDTRLREGLIALTIEDTLGQLERRWRERLDQPAFDAAQPVDYNPAVGLALDIAQTGLPVAALLAEPACLMAKAQVLHQIEALEAAWIELGNRRIDPARFLCNAIDLIARTQRRIETAGSAASAADGSNFWPAVAAGVRRECRQIHSGFANRLHAALRRTRAR